MASRPGLSIRVASLPLPAGDAILDVRSYLPHAVDVADNNDLALVRATVDDLFTPAHAQNIVALFLAHAMAPVAMVERLTVAGMSLADAIAATSAVFAPGDEGERQ